MILSTKVNFIETLVIDQVMFLLEKIAKLSETTVVKYKVAAVDPSVKTNEVINYLRTNSYLYGLLELIFGQIICDSTVVIETIEEEEWIVLILCTTDPDCYISDLLEPDAAPISIYNYKNKVDLSGSLYDITLKIDKVTGYISRYFDTYISSIDINISKEKMLYVNGYALTYIYESIIHPNVILDFSLNLELLNSSIKFANHMIAKKCDDTVQLIYVTIPDSLNGITVVDISEDSIAGYVNNGFTAPDLDGALFGIIPYFYHNPTTLYYIKNINKIITDHVKENDGRNHFDVFFDVKILKLDDDQSIFKYVNVDYMDTEVIYYETFLDVKFYFCIYRSIESRDDECYCGYYYNFPKAKDDFYNYISESNDITGNVFELYTTQNKTYFILKK